MVNLPNTALEIIEKYPGSFRADHPDFGDVAKTTYARGKITDFGLSKENPITLDETCTVEVEGGEYGDVPFFYHCRQGPAPPPPAPPPSLPPGWEWLEDLFPSLLPAVEQDDGAGILEENGALRRGAWAYYKGQEVKVLLNEKNPVCVMGHMDYPHKCHNIFQVKTRDWFGTRSTQGFMCSLRKTYGTYNEKELKDQYNKNLNLNLIEKAYRLFGYREFRFGTILLFYGDWLIKIGPVMYIFMVSSIGWPGPSTRDVTILATLYDSDLEKEAIAAGKEKEKLYPKGLWGGAPPWEFESIKYPGFDKQTDFSRYMTGYYKGINGEYGGDTPRWVYTEIFTEPMGYKK